MRKQKLPFIILLLLAIIATGGIFLLRETLIIQMGIVFYRRIQLTVTILSAAAILICIIGMITSGRKKTADPAETATGTDTGSPSAADAELSVSSGLDSHRLQNLLRENMNGEWHSCQSEIATCLEQLETMDRYQDKLQKLLKKNGADALSDTEDILDRVEQYLCKNVRKVLNFMSVADTGDAADQEMIRSKLKNCETLNTEQLEQTQQFLFALTEFLNQQGDEDTGTDMLQLYRQTILDSLNRNI